MSENGYGLASLLGSNEEAEIEIKLLNPSGDYSGVSFFFKGGPLDAKTDSGYSHILQRNTRQKKSTLDEANRYVFGRRFTRAAGVDEANLRAVGFTDEQVAAFNNNPTQFLLKSERMWPLVRRATVQYLDAVTPDAEESKSAGA